MHAPICMHHAAWIHNLHVPFLFRHGDMLIEDSCILLVVSYLLDNKIILEKVGLLKYGSMES